MSMYPFASDLQFDHWQSKPIGDHMFASLTTTPDVIARSVPLNVIDDPEFNSRISSSAEDDAALLSSVKSGGVRTPIRVRQTSVTPLGSTGVPADFRCILIYGTRRLKAARAAGMAEIPAIIELPTPDMAGSQYKMNAMMDNAVENLSRKDLTPFEQARTFDALRVAKWKLDDVAIRTGMSKGYISSLCSMYAKLAPEILTEWQKGGNPAATTNFLRTLTDADKFPNHNAQVVAFREQERMLAAPPADDSEMEDPDDSDSEDAEDLASETPESKPGPKKFSVAESRYKGLLRALKKAKSPAITLEVAKYLVGAVDFIKGVIEEPKEETEESDKSKKAKK